MKRVFSWTFGIFGVVLVVAVIALFIIGRRADAGVIRASAQIRRPPDAVWPWLCEPDKLKTWVGWLVEVREAEPHTVGIGNRRVWVMEDRNNGNQKMEVAGVVEQWDPPRHLTVGLNAPGSFSGRQMYSLTDLGGVTRFELEGRYIFNHWFAKLLEPLITANAQSKLEKDVAELKRMVETQTPIAAR